MRMSVFLSDVEGYDSPQCKEALSNLRYPLCVSGYTEPYNEEVFTW